MHRIACMQCMQPHCNASDWLHVMQYCQATMHWIVWLRWHAVIIMHCISLHIMHAAIPQCTGLMEWSSMQPQCYLRCWVWVHGMTCSPMLSTMQEKTSSPCCPLDQCLVNMVLRAGECTQGMNMNDMQSPRHITKSTQYTYRLNKLRRFNLGMFGQ